MMSSFTEIHTHEGKQQKKLSVMKNLKASGCYLIKLKVNDFSISRHPRLILVTETGSHDSFSCIPALKLHVLIIQAFKEKN